LGNRRLGLTDSAAAMLLLLLLLLAAITVNCDGTFLTTCSPV
jgi:hypothetical protein